MILLISSGSNINNRKNNFFYQHLSRELTAYNNLHIFLKKKLEYNNGILDVENVYLSNFAAKVGNFLKIILRRIIKK